MLDGAQKGIAIDQDAIFVGPEVTVLAQPRQGFERVTGAQLRLALAVGQLQVLRHKLGVADRAFTQLDVAPDTIGLAQLRLGQLFHRVHFSAHRVGAGAEQQGIGAAQEPRAHRFVTGHDACPQQRLFLPQPGIACQVGQIPVHRRDQRADAAPGAQAHVDAIEETLGRGLGQRLDQPLAQPLERRDVAIRQKQQVDVGAVVELTAAQLAHAEHHKTLGRHPQRAGQQLETDPDDAVGQLRELRRHRGQVEQADQIARPDAQQLPVMVSAQAVQCFGAGSARIRRARPARGPVRLRIVLLGAFRLADGVALDQVFEVLGRAQQDVREKLAAGKEGDQHLQRARIGGHGGHRISTGWGRSGRSVRG